MKRFLFLFLFAFNCNSHDLNLENKPVIYFVSQNPLGAYYGDRVASHLAKTFKQHQVRAIYLKMDVGTSDSNINYLLNYIVSDVKKVEPKYVFVHNSGLTTNLKKELGSDFIISDFSAKETDNDVLLENPIARLMTVLNAFDYSANKFYILSDRTNQSKRNSSVFKNLLIENKVKESDIQLIELKDAKHLTKELNRLNGVDQGIIVNALYVLRDNDINKMKYAVDLKNQLTYFNKKHIDISPYLGKDKNEALIFLIDLDQASIFFNHYILKSERQNKKVRFRVLLNVDRFDHLGLKDNYMKNINVIDGIVYDKH